MNSPSDWHLLQRHLQGDRAAIESLILRHIHLVYSTACRLVSPTEADDITQTVFLLLTQKAKTIAQRESLAPWLHRATQLCASNLRKREGRHRRHIQEAAMHLSATPPQDSPELHTQRLELLDRALLRLKKPERAVILIHHLQQQSMESTAQHLGITPAAAKKRAARALEKLRHLLTPHGQTTLPAAALVATLLAANTRAPAATIQTAITLAHGAPAPALITALAKTTSWSLSTPKIAAASALAALLTIAATLTTILFALSNADTLPTPTAATILATPIAAPTTPAEIVTTAPASPNFQGWIQIGPPEDTPLATLAHVTHINTATGAMFIYSKSPQETSLTYRNPKTGEFVDYHASTNLIRVGSLSPDQVERLTERPVALLISFADLSAALRDLLGTPPANITHSLDEGLDRYNFTSPIQAAKKALAAQGDEKLDADVELLAQIPSAIWLDPVTHLTRKTLLDDNLTTYTYGGPDITSIYDAGAPRSANVYDNRPTAETTAVLDRINQRWQTPLPDGVSVILNESMLNAGISVYARSKNHWTRRAYTITSPKPDLFTIDLPPDWTTTGTDEFFRRLANASSSLEESGDETDVRFRDFTTYDFPLHTDYPDGSSMTITTRAHYTGRAARSMTRNSSSAHQLFEVHLTGQFDVDNHASVITDLQRPGLLGLRDEYRRLTPDSIRAEDVYWIDPAHGDRLVQHIEESFEDPLPGPPQSAIVSSSGRYKSISDYSDYATLPDGREYAARSTTTDYYPQQNGKFVPAQTRSTLFHFFPDRTLPPLKAPATQPVRPQ